MYVGRGLVLGSEWSIGSASYMGLFVHGFYFLFPFEGVGWDCSVMKIK